MNGAHVKTASGRPCCKWRVENLLVAGRRVSGDTFAPSPDSAVVNVAARNARDLGVDIAAAVAGARRDSLKRVNALTDFQPLGGARFGGSDRPAVRADSSEP